MTSVRVVIGFAGWWIYIMDRRLKESARWIPRAYTTPNRAAAAARRRGFNVQAIER